MGFEINQEEYDEATTNEQRQYINKPGNYTVKIEAAKVIKIKKMNGYKTGVVEFRVVEGPDDGAREGTGCNWMACTNPTYARLQLSELKNFAQEALRAQAGEDEPSDEELGDPGIINSLFVDPDDHAEGKAPQSPAVGLTMKINFTEKTNKAGKSFTIGSWV